MSDPQLLLTLPPDAIKQIVEAQVQAAIVSALNKDSKVLVEHLVKTVLGQKRNNYDRHPIWMETFNAMVTQEITAALKVFVDEHRVAIRAAVVARLGKDGKRIVADIADRFAGTLSQGFHIYFTYDNRTGREDT